MASAFSGSSPRANPLVVSPREAGYMLSLGLTRIYELVGAGELVSYTDGRSRRITVESIHAYIRRRIAAGLETEARAKDEC